MRGLLVLCMIVGGLLSACTRDGLSRVTLKGQIYKVEVAADDASRQRGLMFRDSMPADHGMLFIFPQSGYQSFWMKNTHIPLDILYFDSNRGFVNGAFYTPPCGTANPCPNYPSTGMARYVLELNAGVGAALDLVPGDKIELPEPLAPAH